MTTAMRRRWYLLLPGVILAAVGCSGISSSRCPALDSSDRARLQKYVQNKYSLSALPQLLEASPTDSGCYRALRFVAGDRNAPVTLTVFSDLQCPFCAKTARMLTSEILTEDKAGVRLVYRHFPLPGHTWARPAAEVVACAQMQGDQYFWQLHDFIFEHQREITSANFGQLLLGATSGLDGFDQDQFRNCQREGTARARVDKDIEFGRWNGVAGTPTLFVNERRLQPGAPPEQIRTMIRELSGH